MGTFKAGKGPWVQYRALNPVEIDYHFERRDRDTPYESAMAEVHERLADAVRQAQKDGRDWLLITHGSSTSRPGKTTARSVVRNFMRSPAATPYIVRHECIQHDTVFVARIRQLVAKLEYDRALQDHQERT